MIPLISRKLPRMSEGAVRLAVGSALLITLLATTEATPTPSPSLPPSDCDLSDLVCDAAIAGDQVRGVARGELNGVTPSRESEYTARGNPEYAVPAGAAPVPLQSVDPRLGYEVPDCRPDETMSSADWTCWSPEAQEFFIIPAGGDEDADDEDGDSEPGSSLGELAGGVREFTRVRISPAPVILQPDQDRSEEHTSELQSRGHLVCRLLLERK